MIRMKSAGSGGISIEGVSYKPDKFGHVVVPAEHRGVCESHGYEVVSDVEARVAVLPKPEAVANMTRSQLYSFCEDNNIELADGTKLPDIRRKISDYVEAELARLVPKV